MGPATLARPPPCCRGASENPTIVRVQTTPMFTDGETQKSWKFQIRRRLADQRPSWRLLPPRARFLHHLYNRLKLDAVLNRQDRCRSGRRTQMYSDVVCGLGGGCFSIVSSTTVTDRCGGGLSHRGRLADRVIYKAIGRQRERKPHPASTAKQITQGTGK